MDDLAAAEADKYRRMWQLANYRNRSPGELVAEEVLTLLGTKPGQSIMDYGCGTGRAAQIFKRRGLIVTCTDIVDNCLDPNSGLILVVAPLWNLPTWLPGSDWCFCSDVLEHLPPEKVDDALEALAVRTYRGGFLQPAAFPDRSGKRIGETFHLTVQPLDWWVEKVSQYFRVELPKEPLGPWKPGRKIQMLVWAK